MRGTMKKLTQGATRLLVLALGLGLAGGAWADLVAEWGPGDFPVSNAGSYDNMTSEKGGLTLSKNNGGNTSTADYMMIATSGGWPLTINGMDYQALTVAIAYSLASDGDKDGAPISYTTGRGANIVYSYMESGAMYAGWNNGNNDKYGNLNVTTPADETIHYLVFAYSKTGGTYMYYDGATSASASGYYGNSGLKAGDSGTSSGNTSEIVLGAQRGPKQIINGMKVHYVAVYNSSLSSSDVATAYIAARSALGLATPVVDGSNNCVFNITGDLSYDVSSDTTYNSITFNVAEGKTLVLSGAKLTGTNGITVNGGTVKLLTANTQLSGALGGTGTVAYPAGTLPSGVTYGATWTGTIWVKGLQGNEARNFDSYGQGTSKVKISGITGYLNSNPIITFSRELVLDDDTYGFAMKLGNGNSPAESGDNANRCAIFKKLSGDGTFTAGGSTGGNGVYSWPIIRIIDSSEFTGSINCQVESGAQLGGVIFSKEDEEMPDTMYNMFSPNTQRIFVSAGRTAATGNAVTVPAGKTWVARGGVDVRGDLIVNGTLNAAIVNNAGSITVNPGATVSNQGSKRDFTGWIVADGASVSITQTAEEYGKGVTTVTGAGNVSSITVLDPTGAVAGTITPATSTTLETAVRTSGKACWCDYEMNGDLSNAGTDTTGLTYDSNMSAGNSFYNSQMLYTYTHPYRGVTYPSTWTAVVRCTVPKVANGAVITFGTCTGGLIGLIAGDDPDTEMKLIKTTGNSAYTTLATMSIVNGTTAQHVYVFIVENNSTVKVYCDGSEVLNQTYSAFTLGGGVQVGSVHGGINSTGITAVWKGNTYAGLTEDDLKDARIDCVRLYQYSLSAAQIAALSVEFPAVKLYRATVAANANTDWGSLTWSPSWDGGNSSSKIILTVEGDASLTLPDSITANEFVMNVPASNVLTLSKASGGTTLSVTEPIEIAGGTIYFNPGISQPIGLGDLNFGGTGTVRLGNGTLVNNGISGSASVELLSGVSAIMYGGSISNPLKGAGLLDYSYRNSLPSGLSFGDWTGTVKLPGFTADALNLNNYGKSGSVAEITAVNGGWIAEAGKTIAPTLKLSGNMTIDAMSSWTYTFAEITGSGNLSFSTSANTPTVNITKIAEGYSGTISSTLGNPVTIATLDRAAGTTVTPGTKILSTSSGVQASALTVGGEATSIIPVFDTDGLYVKAASVTKNDATTYHNTVADALTAAGSDAATITLLAPTDNAITLAVGQTLVNGNLTTGGVTGPNGYEVVNNNGTYTLVDNTASTWSPGENSDNKWATAANWSTGYIPSQYTVVTFPASESAHVVKLTLNNANSEAERHRCASMVLNGNVTFQRANSGPWAYVFVYGNVSGTGTLTFEQTGLNTPANSSIAVSCPVVGNADTNDNFFSGTNATYTFSAAVDIAAGEFKADRANLVFSGPVTIRNGGYVKSNGEGASATFNGGIVIPANASASLTVNGGSQHTIASTVTLGAGATFTIPTATTVSGATFTAASGYDVVHSTSGDNTVYTTELKGATVSNVAVSYGPDYASATVTATVSDTTLDYYISWSSGEPVKGSVSGSQVTFDVSGINHTTEYQSAAYSITAKDGEAAVTTTGGSGTSVAADTTPWFSHNSSGLTGGAWSNAVDLSEGPATVEDNTFAATAESTSSRVVLEFNVCFSATNDADIDGTAQAAIKLGEVESAAVLEPNSTWTPVFNADITPDPAEPYKVVLTIDYGTGSYGVTVGDNVLTNASGSASFQLAASKTSVKDIDFAGSGTLTSMKGDQVEGYMVKDNAGHWYATIQDATQAYNSANGPYTVLHDGTAPSGWKIDGNTLIKLAKGFFFMAY